MVSGPKKKKNICDWNLKSKDKIGLKINVKIKLEQILRSTKLFLLNFKNMKKIQNIIKNKKNKT